MPGANSAMKRNLFSKSGWRLATAVSVGLMASQLLAGSPTDMNNLVAANTAFAFDLMNQITRAQPGGNVFISPFSVSSALQMVVNGAAGGTKAEMQQVLKTSGVSAGALNGAFKDLNQQLEGRKDVTLNLANGMWVQKDFHIKPAFVDTNRQYFRAELASVDFNNPQAAKTINGWAEQKTKGKITKVVEFPFPALTRLILANAIYFKGKWVEPFKKDLTKPRDFHLANGQTKQTPMMVQDSHFQYQENAKFQAVKLPYNGGLQMELYLPATNSTPQMFLADIAGKETWRDSIQSDFSRREGTVTLPKFKMEFEIELNNPLQSLGMKSAFANTADFSGIADEPLNISEVKQKSYVDVNEEGTEAAAVTTVGIRAMALMKPIEKFSMVLDRPFFFVISDATTGSILFMGVVNEPK
jgi:serpin B